jgi:hypothetical protein
MTRLSWQVYGEEMRAVKLVTSVRAYAPTKTDFLFERRLNDYLPGKLYASLYHLADWKRMILLPEC